jgi:hypothetical protein
MSTNKYCTACGTKHVVGLTPIKFCSSCGNPFEAAAPVQQNTQASRPIARPVARPISQSNPMQNVDSPVDDYFELPQINASDFVIEGDRPKKMTVGDIRNNGVGGGERDASPMITPEQVQENFAKLFAKEREATSESNG